MFFLGLCSVLQCVFLPGFLAARALGVTGAVRTATSAFALSLIINWLLVAALVLVHAYLRPVVLSIFALECLFALRMLRPWARPDRGGPGAIRDRWLRDTVSLEVKTWVALLLALTVLIGYLLLLLKTTGRVFDGWDDVVSWNRWAVDWYRGGLPVHTWHYPQLLPANWSITYMFIGDERIQFFARGLMPFFGIATVVAIAGLARGADAFFFLMAAAIGGQFLRSSNQVTAGLADVPTAFFAAMAIAELMGVRSAAGVELTRRAVLGAVFAAAAALTKQAGLYLAAVYPILVLVLARESAGRLRMLALLYGLIVVLALPWYAFKEIEIRGGRDTSEVSYVTHDIHRGAAPTERLARALTLVNRRLRSPAVLVVVAALWLVGFADRATRWLSGLVTLPYALIWALWFSYDRRNLTLALVPCGIGCAAGLTRLLRGRLRRMITWRVPAAVRSVARVPGRAVLFGAGVALVGLGFAIPDSALRERQDRLQRRIGDPELDQALYRYQAQIGIRGRILTSYGLLAYLPGLDSCYMHSHLDDLAEFRVAAADPRVSHLLVPRSVAPLIGAEFERGLRSGRYTRVFATRDYVFARRQEWPVGEASSRTSTAP
jgi:hypothetical protein